MKKKSLMAVNGIGTLVLFLSVNVWAQHPAESQSRLQTRAVLNPSGGSPSDPEQEAAEEMNRILRSLVIVQKFFGEPLLDLEAIVEGTYEQMLELLQLRHMLAVELHEALNDPNPAPGQVGQLIIEIRELNVEIKEIGQSWGDGIETELTEDQAEKLAMVRRVAGLIPAFKQVGLIPPPPPRLRSEDE